MTRTNKKWQKDLIKFCLWLPVIFIARLFLLQYVSFDWPIYVVALLGTVCLFPPQKGYMALALFLIWPFFSKMPEMPVGKLIFWGWIVGVEMMIPFVFLYIKIAEVGKVLRELKKKSFFLYNLIFLLPTVYLLGMSVWGLCRSKIPFQNELNKNGVSVVINENEAHQWQKISNISFISDQSMLGQSLLKMYGRKTPMVVWKDQWGHVVLLPDSSVSDVHQFISNWHGYHALYRP